MTVLPVRDLGAGVPTLLVHGVGLDARHYEVLAELLAERMRVLVPDRPGYGSGRDLPAAPIEEQIEDLLETLDAHTASRAVYIGVSGGATLGLAVLARRPERFRGAVLHEPLLGPLAPELHARVTLGAARLAADPSPSASLAFVRELVGDLTWDALDRHDVDEVVRLDPIIRAEVAAFTDVAFTDAELARLQSVPITTTVGRASDPIRRRAANVLAARSHARVVQIPGQHFAPRTAPEAIAAAAFELLATTAGSRG